MSHGYFLLYATMESLERQWWKMVSQETCFWFPVTNNLNRLDT